MELPTKAARVQPYDPIFLLRGDIVNRNTCTHAQEMCVKVL